MTDGTKTRAETGFESMTELCEWARQITGVDWDYFTNTYTGEYEMVSERTPGGTNATDELYESMQTKAVVWFKDWETAIEGSLLQEFTVPVRKLVVNDAGSERFIWEGKPDHQLHAGVYDMLAGTVLEMNIVRDYSDIGPFVNTVYHGGGGFESDKPKGDPRDDSVMIHRG